MNRGPMTSTVHVRDGRIHNKYHTQDTVYCQLATTNHQNDRHYHTSVHPHTKVPQSPFSLLLLFPLVSSRWSPSIQSSNPRTESTTLTSFISLLIRPLHSLLVQLVTLTGLPYGILYSILRADSREYLYCVQGMSEIARPRAFPTSHHYCVRCMVIAIDTFPLKSWCGSTKRSTFPIPAV